MRQDTRGGAGRGGARRAAGGGVAVLFDAVYSDAELVFSLPVRAWRKYELESRPAALCCVWDEDEDEDERHGMIVL